MKRDDLVREVTDKAMDLFEDELHLLNERYIERRINAARKVGESHRLDQFPGHESLKEMGLDGECELGHEFMDLVYQLNELDARLAE